MMMSFSDIQKRKILLVVRVYDKLYRVIMFLLTNKCFLTGLTGLTGFFAFGKILSQTKKEPVNPVNPVKKNINRKCQHFLIQSSVK